MTDNPTDTVEPTDLAGVRDALTAVPGPLLFRGAGTKLDWGGLGTPPRRVVSTRRLDRLLAHDPGDLTATVQAGMPLEQLQAELAAHGQWLALDAPSAPAGATIGGLLASGDAGPRRLRYGTLRDLVIGTTAVLADGSVSRSGGNVIKNVAGYDLAKLWHGSLGTLGLVVEVVVRLHPLPPAGATVRVDADLAEAAALARTLVDAATEPSALDWIGEPGGRGALLARYEGRAEAVEHRVRAALTLASSGCRRLDAGDEQAAWAEVAGRLHGRDGETVLRAVTPAGQLERAAAALADARAERDVDARLHAHVRLGLQTATLCGPDPVAVVEVVERWRTALAGLGGHVVARRRPPAVGALVDAWGPPPPSLPLMRALKDQLDPERRCAPGRYVGGL